MQTATIQAGTDHSAERGLWRTLAIGGGVIALLKGLRLPNLYAATAYQVNYSQGFIKRGLIGSALKILGVPVGHYAVVAIFSFIMLAALFWLLARFARTAGLTKSRDGWVIIALFSASYAVTYLTHAIGFFEIILGVLVLLVLSIRRPAAYQAATAAVTIAGILIHELFLLVFLLPLVLAGLLDALSENWVKKWRIAGLMGMILVGVIVTLILELYPTLNAAHFDALKSSIIATSDFPLKMYFFDGVIMSSAFDGLRLMADTAAGKNDFGANFAFWRDLGLMGALFLPNCAFLLAVTLRIIDKGLDGMQRRCIKILAVACSLSPLLLVALGLDIYRWGTLTEVASFLTLLIVWRSNLYAGHAPFFLPPSWRNMAILLIAANLASGGGLLNNYTIRTFPFSNYLQDTVILFRDGPGALMPKD